MWVFPLRISASWSAAVSNILIPVPMFSAWQKHFQTCMQQGGWPVDAYCDSPHWKVCHFLLDSNIKSEVVKTLAVIWFFLINIFHILHLWMSSQEKTLNFVFVNSTQYLWKQFCFCKFTISPKVLHFLKILHLNVIHNPFLYFWMNLTLTLAWPRVNDTVLVLLIIQTFVNL